MLSSDVDPFCVVGERRLRKGEGGKSLIFEADFSAATSTTVEYWVAKNKGEKQKFIALMRKGCVDHLQHRHGNPLFICIRHGRIQFAMLRARRDQAIGDNSSNCGEDQNTEHDANDHTSIALLLT